MLVYFANAFAPGSLLLPIHRLIRKGSPPSDAAWSERLPGWSQTKVALPSAEAIPDLLAQHLAPLRDDRYAFAADDASGQLRIFSRPRAARRGALRARHPSRGDRGGLRARRGGRARRRHRLSEERPPDREGRARRRGLRRALPEPAGARRRLPGDGGRRGAAAEVDLLLPQAPHRAGVPAARRGGCLDASPKGEPEAIGKLVPRVLRISASTRRRARCGSPSAGRRPWAPRSPATAGPRRSARTGSR